MLIEDMPLNKKRVLIRVDFNVPIRDNKVSDDTRIRKALKTINYVMEKGGYVTLCSHLGRPKGRDDKYSLRPVAEKLREMGYKVILTLDSIGDSVYKAIANQDDNKTIILLENLRFHSGEKECDEEFAKKLAEPFEYFIQDAFGVLHRKAASTYIVPKLLPSAMGFLVKEEIEKLSVALNPEKPFVVIIGGAKISSKLKLISKFLEKADKILLGGAMIFTFYKAMGLEIGKSIYEEEMIDEAKDLVKNDKIVLPIDIVCSNSFEEAKDVETRDYNNLNKECYGLDIGNKSIKRFERIIKDAKTVLWNGPMGLFEIKPFDNGTNKIAEILANINGKVIVGGGDSVSAINKTGLKDKFYHISTGGGASLEFLEGKILPGIEAIEF
jgi:3-phosphoglycerate kinase